MIVAGIDVGTNTIRLLVADVDAAAVRELHSGRIIPRLGEGLDRSGAISPDAEKRSLAALAAFAEDARRYSPSCIDAIGTSALRRASNAAAFIRKTMEQAGVHLRVVSGEEEARLTFKGVRFALERTTGEPMPDPSVVIDIGGGSTEVVRIFGGCVREVKSLQLGAVYLTERFIRHDPPREEEIDAIRTAVRGELGMHADLFCRDGSPALIGTAGTITTLAAIDQEMTEYDPERINGYILRGSSLDVLIGTLSDTTLQERRKIKGLEAGREDIILAGAIIAQEIQMRIGASAMLVSDWGLREGIVLDGYERQLLRTNRAEL